MAIQEYYSQCLKDAPAPPQETTSAKDYTPPAAQYTPPTKEYTPPAPKATYNKLSPSYRRRQLVNSVTNNGKQ